jgi:hypothetical protein
MPIYSFTCECGYTFDKRTAMDVRTIQCDACSCEAKREEVYKFSMAGLTRIPPELRTYRQEFKDFREATAELEYKQSRAEEAAGRSLPVPPLARIAKEKAAELQSKGVVDSADWVARRGSTIV